VLSIHRRPGATPTDWSTVNLLLVRHADAGERSGWTGPDLLRPLADHGRVQARGLVALLGDRFAIGSIVSSPSVRCIETVAPLAAVLELDVTVDTALAEGADPRVAHDRLFAGGDAAVVLCSHGDVIPGLLEIVAAGGVDLGPSPRCQKASTWVLAGERGVDSASYLPPP
jgi:phosphohistidine phosphatase SixA